MKLMNKLRDLFIDIEESDEIDSKEITISKKEMEKDKTKDNKEKEDDEVRFKLPKVMEEDIKKEENNDDLFLKLNENIKKEDKSEFKEMVPKSRTEKHGFGLGMDFENPYAKDDSVIKKEEPRKVADLYKDPKDDKKTLVKKSKVKEEKKVFKASPVISPVYGVLDKNYKTDEVLEKNENSYEIQRLSKKIDFETVRRKAFGNLSDDIKNNLCEDCELLKEVKRLEKIKETELLSDMMDANENHKGPSIEDAYDNYSDFGVSYEAVRDKVVVNDDEIKIFNNNERPTEPEEIEVKQPKSRFIDLDITDEDGDKEELDLNVNKVPNFTKDELSDDLFDLIDSMYKEEEE